MVGRGCSCSQIACSSACSFCPSGDTERRDVLGPAGRPVPGWHSTGCCSGSGGTVENSVERRGRRTHRRTSINTNLFSFQSRGGEQQPGQHYVVIRASARPHHPSLLPSAQPKTCTHSPQGRHTAPCSEDLHQLALILPFSFYGDTLILCSSHAPMVPYLLPHQHPSLGHCKQLPPCATANPMPSPTPPSSLQDSKGSDPQTIGMLAPCATRQAHTSSIASHLCQSANPTALPWSNSPPQTQHNQHSQSPIPAAHRDAPTHSLPCTLLCPRASPLSPSQPSPTAGHPQHLTLQLSRHNAAPDPTSQPNIPAAPRVFPRTAGGTEPCCQPGPPCCPHSIPPRRGRVPAGAGVGLD